MKTHRFYNLFYFSGLLLALLLAGCPKQVNQARNGESLLSSGSNRWGVPNTRVVTGGFNGSPTEQVGEASKASTQAVPAPAPSPAQK